MLFRLTCLRSHNVCKYLCLVSFWFWNIWNESFFELRIKISLWKWTCWPVKPEFFQFRICCLFNCEDHVQFHIHIFFRSSKYAFISYTPLRFISITGYITNSQWLMACSYLQLAWFIDGATTPDKTIRQFHLFSNFCALLLSPLNGKSKPPSHPLVKVVLF